MDNKKMYVDMLYKYAGLFEEVFDKNELTMEEDNWDDYEWVCKELRTITGIHTRETTIEKINELRDKKES